MEANKGRKHGRALSIYHVSEDGDRSDLVFLLSHAYVPSLVINSCRFVSYHCVNHVVSYVMLYRNFYYFYFLYHITSEN
jgi:hypothetical protein